MRSRYEKQRFINVYDEKGNARYVTVIGGLPFYQSTGMNSREKDTWFPFIGLNEIPVYRAPKGLFLKPNTYLDNVDKAFPEKMAAYIKKNRALLGDTFTRLGNFEGMCLSMLIGGGFWLSTEGMSLKHFMHENYSNDIQVLSEKFYDTLNEIKSLRRVEKKLSASKDTALINQWLDEQGSMVQKETYGLNIDFSYSNFKTPKIQDDLFNPYIIIKKIKSLDLRNLPAAKNILDQMMFDAKQTNNLEIQKEVTIARLSIYLLEDTHKHSLKLAAKAYVEFLKAPNPETKMMVETFRASGLYGEGKRLSLILKELDPSIEKNLFVNKENQKIDLPITNTQENTGLTQRKHRPPLELPQQHRPPLITQENRLKNKENIQSSGNEINKNREMMGTFKKEVKGNQDFEHFKNDDTKIKPK